MPFHLRHAVAEDSPALAALIELSVRELQKHDYTPAQMEGALASVFGVDSQLVADGTYFVVEALPEREIAGCGGWSKRRTLFGGDQWHGREDLLLDPSTEAAKVRAFFVHPRWARR
ncbi:MAG TPA: GNAT family N-acetyltransferase, partial [Bryobacteraceae bacterium]